MILSFILQKTDGDIPMTNPCIEYCYVRFGKRYTTACDTTCEFAKMVKENRELRSKLEKLTAEQDKTTDHKNS